MHAETVLAQGGCGPLCGTVGTLPSSSSWEGCWVQLAAPWLESNRVAGRFSSPFPLADPRAGNAVLCSSHGGRSHKPLASGSCVIARKQAEMEEGTCCLPLSPTTCLHIFSLSPKLQIQIYQRGMGFIPSCVPGWQGDLGHVLLSAMTQFPSCKIGSKCDL